MKVVYFLIIAIFLNISSAKAETQQVVKWSCNPILSDIKLSCNSDLIVTQMGANFMRVLSPLLHTVEVEAASVEEARTLALMEYGEKNAIHIIGVPWDSEEKAHFGISGRRYNTSPEQINWIDCDGTQKLDKDGFLLEGKKFQCEQI